jgi:hypothetical protein
MDVLPRPKLKLCSKCGDSYPAMEEYFRHDKRTQDGFSVTCKPCVKAMQKDPNKAYHDRTVVVKGVLGWRCPLWTGRCGHCEVINTCWRIRNDQPEDLPAKLVGPVAGSLRPSVVPHGQSFKNSILARRALQAKRDALRKKNGGEQ